MHVEEQQNDGIDVWMEQKMEWNDGWVFCLSSTQRYITVDWGYFTQAG